MNCIPEQEDLVVSCCALIKGFSTALIVTTSLTMDLFPPIYGFKNFGLQKWIFAKFELPKTKKHSGFKNY